MVQNMVDEQMRQAIFWTICWIDGIVVNFGKTDMSKGMRLTDAFTHHLR